MASEEGASNNERLLAAAKSDNEDLLLEVFEQPGTFDINYKDGLGNTALHYAVSHSSYDALDHILSHEQCDVDPINRLEGATPLHLAVVIDNPDGRAYLVENLLDAGADYTIQNKHGQTAEQLLNPNDERTLALFRKARADADMDEDDIAFDYGDDDDIASDDSE